MVKKIQKKGGSARASTASAANGSGASPLAGAIKDSAQQIWLAGLGAFAKAQAEGGKAFETLVKEGMSIQRKTQSVAEDRINEATSRVSNMANEIQSKAAGQWDKLESLFEERVAKALGKLGVPSARDVDALIERIDALNQQVLKLGGVGVSAARPARKASTGAKAAPRKAAAKRAPARKAAAKKASAA
jgi:poly(hydroxyalkanoate) granule-associated protein